MPPPPARRPTRPCPPASACPASPATAPRPRSTGRRRRAGVRGAELRQVGAVPVNDSGSDAAAGHTVVALHAGYTVQRPGWTLRAFGRVDNLLDRRYAGSVIVNEGNGRYFEPAPGRTLFVGLDGRWSF
nr:TonB-dependent receptor [Aquabacterium sp. J223]